MDEVGEPEEPEEPEIMKPEDRNRKHNTCSLIHTSCFFILSSLLDWGIFAMVLHLVPNQSAVCWCHNSWVATSINFVGAFKVDVHQFHFHQVEG
jgi:hypothetical protein